MWKICKLKEIQELKPNFITGGKCLQFTEIPKQNQIQNNFKKTLIFPYITLNYFKLVWICRKFRVIFKPYELKIQSNLDKIHRFFWIILKFFFSEFLRITLMALELADPNKIWWVSSMYEM